MQLARYLAAAFLVIGLAVAPASAEDKKKPKRPEPNRCAGGFAPEFKLRGDVQNPKTFRITDLEQYFSSRFSVSYFSGSSGLVTKVYIGVPLIDLLNEAVIVTDPNRRNDILRKYVVAAATDCYEAIIAVADLLPNFGAQHVFIAFETGDGQPLDESEGMARLVITGDKQGGRLVSNVSSITVRSAP